MPPSFHLNPPGAGVSPFVSLHVSLGEGVSSFRVSRMKRAAVDDAEGGAVFVTDAGGLLSARLPRKDALSAADQQELGRLLDAMSAITPHQARGEERGGISHKFICTGTKCALPPLRPSRPALVAS